MTQTTLTPVRFENGIWEGALTSVTAPRVEVLYQGQSLSDIDVAPDGDVWSLRISVPNTALSEGVHSFVVLDIPTGEKLGSFAIIAGTPAADDLLAEVDLLRAELDMLKRAVRRLHRPGD